MTSDNWLYDRPYDPDAMFREPDLSLHGGECGVCGEVLVLIGEKYLCPICTNMGSVE